MRLRKKVLLVAAVLVPLCALGGAWLGASGFVAARAAAALDEQFGLELTSEDVAVSLRDGRVVFRGVRVRDRGARLLEADELEVRIGLRAALARDWDVGLLVLRRPVIHVVVEEGSTTNFARIWRERRPVAELGGPLRLRDVRIEDGTLRLEDAVTRPGHLVEHELVELRASVTDLHFGGTPRDERPSDFLLDARLEQDGPPARLSVVAWAPPPEGRPTFALHAAVTGLDLEGLSPYVERKERRSLGGQLVHLALALSAQDGQVADGAVAAHVVENGDELALRFGGDLSDLVFDQDSKLAVLFHMPFAKLGRVGDVALTPTWRAAREVGGGVYDAGGSVLGGAVEGVRETLRLDPLGALQAAGGGVMRGAQQLGGGLLGGAKRLFRVRGDQADPVELESEFAALHARRRVAMLEAAFASAAGDQRRLARIETELETPSALASARR